MTQIDRCQQFCKSFYTYGSVLNRQVHTEARVNESSLSFCHTAWKTHITSPSRLSCCPFCPLPNQSKDSDWGLWQSRSSSRRQTHGCCCTSGSGIQTDYCATRMHTATQTKSPTWHPNPRPPIAMLRVRFRLRLRSVKRHAYTAHFKRHES